LPYEVTTVGSIWPLAKYWTSPTHFGSKSNDASFFDAASTVPEFISLAQGSSPGTPTSTSYFAQNSKLYSLADALAACVNSSGGKAGDGSPCGQLFSMASTAGSAPADTMTAAIQIAQQPDSNVAGIFDLVGVSTAFQPTLTATPQNGVATFSNLTLGTAGNYTLVASSSGLTSSTSASFTVTTPIKLAFTVQPSNAFTGAAISPAVQVAIQDTNGKTVTADSSPVTLALAGSTNLGGTLTVPAENGVATFSNLTVSTGGSYVLSATSPNLTPATSANFTVTVAPVTYYLSPTGSDSNSGLCNVNLPPSLVTLGCAKP
jgi:trimeric autotransporter adhesin